MSQKVNAVPDAAFSVPPLTTTAGTRVSRRRIKVPCNYPGTNYSHNGQSRLPTVVTFDIADNESFLDMEKSMIVLDFTPEVFHDSESVKLHHPVGFDGSSQAIMARVRIGNSQGLIIEELQAYGTWANIMDCYAQSENQTEHHLIDQSSALKSEMVPQKVFGSAEYPSGNIQSHKKRRLFLRFKHSSFLKSCRMIPLFLMRNGLRFEIEFEDVYKCLTRNLSMNWVGPFYANVHGSEVALSTGSLVYQYCDWYFESTGTALNMVVKKNSQLARALNLRELLKSNYNVDLNAADANLGAVTVPSKKFTGQWAIPLKIEYTDSFGTPKVLLQGIFQIHSQPYKLGANGLVNMNDPEINQLAQQYAWLQESITDGGVNFGIHFQAHEQIVYLLTFKGSYEGFSNLNRGSIAQTAYLPYGFSSSELRAYVDLSDFSSVPNDQVDANPAYVINYTNAAADGISSSNIPWSETNILQQPRYCSWSIGKAVWNYSIANVEMICDFVKPSSEVFLQFQQSFQAPAGIPYAYKRVLYHTRVLNPSEGLQQISLPISVRSLRGIVCVLSDKLAWSRSSDNTSKSFNSLSAFMKRGLIRAQLVIGGQNYPSYDLNLTENGAEQIPELECLFNVAGLGSFNPSFDSKELLSTRNYMVGVGVGGYDGSWTMVNEAVLSGNSSMGIQQYHDTSKFVLGISTMKKDGDFVTGVDTSQAGSVSLNLYFKRSPDLANMFPGDSGSNRDIFVQVFCLADAVFTLQNDANLVRY